jgi:hypothetical protein
MDARDKLDNPLVFIVLISIGVAAVFKGGQWAGLKLGWPGMSSFFGAK